MIREPEPCLVPAPGGQSGPVHGTVRGGKMTIIKSKMKATVKNADADLFIQIQKQAMRNQHENEAKKNHCGSLEFALEKADFNSLGS